MLAYYIIELDLLSAGYCICDISNTDVTDFKVAVLNILSFCSSAMIDMEAISTSWMSVRRVRTHPVLFKFSINGSGLNWGPVYIHFIAV